MEMGVGMKKGVVKFFMKQAGMNRLVLAAGIFGFGLAVVGCGGEGGRARSFRRRRLPPSMPISICRPDGGRMPEVEEGRKFFIGETNPDVNCAELPWQGRQAGQGGRARFPSGRSHEVVFRFRLVLAHFRGRAQYEDEGLEEQASEEDRWKLVLFERNFGLAGKGWDATKKDWVAAGQ